MVRLTDQDAHEFETFAPGWRGKVELTGSQSDIRARLLAYWSRLVEDLGMRPFSDSRLIQATKGQRLYWLMLASRSDLAQGLWRKIGSANRQTALEL